MKTFETQKKGYTIPTKTKNLISKKITKMNHHTGQTSSNLDTKSDELQLAILTKQNRRLTREISHFEVKHYQHQDELNLPSETMQYLPIKHNNIEKKIITQRTNHLHVQTLRKTQICLLKHHR